jgi:hypothetical protein
MTMRAESDDHTARDAVAARLRDLLRDRLSSTPLVRVKAFQWRETSHATNKTLITISIKVKGTLGEDHGRDAHVTTEEILLQRSRESCAS